MHWQLIVLFNFEWWVGELSRVTRGKGRKGEKARDRGCDNLKQGEAKQAALLRRERVKKWNDCVHMERKGTSDLTSSNPTHCCYFFFFHSSHVQIVSKWSYWRRQVFALVCCWILNFKFTPSFHLHLLAWHQRRRWLVVAHKPSWRFPN